MAAWRAAYRGMLPPDYLAQLSIDQLRWRWHATITDMRAVERVIVAMEGDDVLGFAYVREPRRPC